MRSRGLMLPNRACQCRTLFFASICAPRPMRTSHPSTLSSAAARWSGVHPLYMARIIKSTNYNALFNSTQIPFRSWIYSQQFLQHHAQINHYTPRLWEMKCNSALLWHAKPQFTHCVPQHGLWPISLTQSKTQTSSNIVHCIIYWFYMFQTKYGLNQVLRICEHTLSKRPQHLVILWWYGVATIQDSVLWHAQLSCTVPNTFFSCFWISEEFSLSHFVDSFSIYRFSRQIILNQHLPLFLIVWGYLQIHMP